jgi:hypothetical protein
MTPTIDEIVVGDEPDCWRDAGFTVDDDGTCRIGRVRVRLVGRDDGKRIRDWSLRDIESDAIVDGWLDGLPTRVSDAAPNEPAVHPNGVVLIDHIVLATPDPPRTTAVFEAAGLVARRTRPTDTYGSPLLQTFFRAGEVIIELIGPQEPSGDGPTGFFGLAHTVDDLDRPAALLGPALGAAKDAVQPGRRIATLRHRDLDISVPTAFLTPEPAAGVAGGAGGDAPDSGHGDGSPPR